MKLLLTGASGFIGTHIGATLTAAGHEVMVATRSAGLDFNQLREPADWQPHLTGIEAVINCVGIIAERHDQSFTTLHYHAPAALFRACVEVGVTRVIQISALGADERAITPYQSSKKAADDVLRRLPLDWFVLRPSLVYGPGGKSTALFRRLASLPVIPLVDRGQQMIQPVHVDDLVAAVLTCLTTQLTCQTIDVVGPNAITFADWIQQLRRQNGKPLATIVSVPYSLARLVAPLAHYLIPLLTADNLRMLQQGNTADVQPLVNLLGSLPRAVP